MESLFKMKNVLIGLVAALGVGYMGGAAAGVLGGIAALFGASMLLKDEPKPTDTRPVELHVGSDGKPEEQKDRFITVKRKLKIGEEEKEVEVRLTGKVSKEGEMDVSTIHFANDQGKWDADLPGASGKFGKLQLKKNKDGKFDYAKPEIELTEESKKAIGPMIDAAYASPTVGGNKMYANTAAVKAAREAEAKKKADEEAKIAALTAPPPAAEVEAAKKAIEGMAPKGWKLDGVNPEAANKNRFWFIMKHQNPGEEYIVFANAERDATGKIIKFIPDKLEKRNVPHNGVAGMYVTLTDGEKKAASFTLTDPNSVRNMLKMLNTNRMTKLNVTPPSAMPGTAEIFEFIQAPAPAGSDFKFPEGTTEFIQFNAPLNSSMRGIRIYGNKSSSADGDYFNGSVVEFSSGYNEYSNDTLTSGSRTRRVDLNDPEVKKLLEAAGVPTTWETNGDRQAFFDAKTMETLLKTADANLLKKGKPLHQRVPVPNSDRDVRLLGFADVARDKLVPESPVNPLDATMAHNNAALKPSTPVREFDEPDTTVSPAKMTTKFQTGWMAVSVPDKNKPGEFLTAYAMLKIKRDGGADRAEGIYLWDGKNATADYIPVKSNTIVELERDPTDRDDPTNPNKPKLLVMKMDSGRKLNTKIPTLIFQALSEDENRMKFFTRTKKEFGDKLKGPATSPIPGKLDDYLDHTTALREPARGEIPGMADASVADILTVPTGLPLPSKQPNKGLQGNPQQTSV